MQGDALFGKGIIGHQALVSKKAEQGPVLYLADNGGKRVRLAVHLPYFFACGIILRGGGGQFPGSLAGFLRPVAQGLAFGQANAQPGKNLVAQRGIFLRRAAFAKEKGMQMGARLLVHDIPEKGREAGEDFRGVAFDIIQKVIGKGRAALPFRAAALLHRIQDLAQLGGHISLRANAGIHPAVHAVGGQLAFQHGRGIEKDAGRGHMPAHHQQGIGIKIEVVRPRSGNGDVEGVAVRAARAADTLQVVGLRRRDGTLDCGGKIADINPHFQRRRTGKEVVVPGGARRVLALERLFDFFAYLAGQQTGMFGGKQPDDVAGAVQVAVKVVFRLCRSVMASATAQAGRALPEFRLVSGNENLLTALITAQARHTGGKAQAVPGKPPDGSSVVQSKSPQHAFPAKQFHGLVQHISCVRLARPQQLRKDPERPLLAPGRARGLPERFKVFHPADRQKAGALVARTESRHIGNPAQSVQIAPVVEQRLEKRMHERRAAVPQMMQKADQKGGALRYGALAQAVAQIVQHHLQRCRNLTYPCRWDMGDGAARALRRAAYAAGKGMRCHNFPGQTPVHVFGQGGMFGQSSLSAQVFVIVPPFHVGMNEGGNVGGQRQTPTPVIGKYLGKILQQGRFVAGAQGLRHGRAQRGGKGTRPEKTRSVGRVLHIVGKGDELFVVVAGRAKENGNNRACETGGATAEDQPGIARPAEGAVRAVVGTFQQHGHAGVGMAGGAQPLFVRAGGNSAAAAADQHFPASRSVKGILAVFFGKKQRIGLISRFLCSKEKAVDFL